ncbi:MAG: hypothetical protein PHR56_07380 [Dehalococcoidales bacterium]|nr:hypothetical protein [Dehalococcoidales bacterium]
MKNQYFGDNRDLFKFDLAEQILKAGLVKGFTYIPMLTADSAAANRVYDRSKAKAGTKNKKLVSFLDKCAGSGKKNIVQLEKYFGSKINIYGKSTQFSRVNRSEYFTGIGRELLSKSLILVDPDIGMEVKRSGEQHLLFDEICWLYEQMDDSILMIYQQFPRADHLEYLHERGEELSDKVTGEGPICVDNDEIVFYFLTAESALEEALTNQISEYTEDYSGQGD